MADYPPPLDQLLARGRPGPYGEAWLDYLALGVSPAHVPDLIRMVTDPVRYDPDEDSAAVWAPTHAWRALGQLRAAEAIGPLLELLEPAVEHDDDWCVEEVPVVLGMIGPQALPALADYLADRGRLEWARVAVGSALTQVGNRHPESRPACVAVLTGQLEQGLEEDYGLNGFLVADLLDLKATEAAPVIEKAFAAGVVDPSIAGDWPVVAWELKVPGAQPPQPAAPPPRPARPLPGLVGDLVGGQSPKARAESRRKKRRQAKKAKKRNRKRR